MGLAMAEDAVASTMDAAFEEKLKEGVEAFEFQAEVCKSSKIFRHRRPCLVADVRRIIY